jgi:hypothetical protein
MTFNEKRVSKAARALLEDGKREHTNDKRAQERKRALLRVRSAIFKCDERFGHAFQEWLPGETITRWIARCDWMEYGRQWFLDVVVPAARAVRDLIPEVPELAAPSFTAPWRGNREPDRHTTYIAEKFSNLVADEPPKKDLHSLADEVGLVLASDGGGYWRRFHAYFQLLAGRIDKLIKGDAIRESKVIDPTPKLSWQRIAILGLSEGESVRSVAKAVRKHPSTLYRDSSVRQAIENRLSTPTGGSIRRGSKREGRIEAVDDPD